MFRVSVIYQYSQSVGKRHVDGTVDLPCTHMICRSYSPVYICCLPSCAHVDSLAMSAEPMSRREVLGQGALGWCWLVFGNI